ncbi:solute carrier family 2, facilitated glucose transporter member 12 [Gadus morhua]|uniref:Solute carrier family 2, facilitated glucose transporter member 12 n=1 Tax=Gadus morhua TaxID=8049 RepID=A0A8C5ANW7_GADMO|nr:solute carrier family 2, facilitated glucose transporter member 12 [Gadus morhua]XP_030201545.1 solute carrier family 2, facilitated glucose transporter member 12 [Gadus morhua]
MDLSGQAERMPSDEPQEHRTLKPCLLRSTGCSWLVVLAAVAASLSGLMLGYEMGLTSGVLLQLRGLLSLSCREQELLVSSHLLGSLLICLTGGPVLDRYGRRCSMLLGAAAVVAGTVVSVAFASLPALMTGRAVIGVGTALSGTAACLYIAEISPQERRGLLVTLYELMLVVGVLLGFSCSYAFAALPDGWRYTFGLVTPVALLQFAGLLLLPPSPRFLVARGRVESARGVLTRLRGGGGGDVDAELRDIRAGLKEESEHGFRELFSGKANLRRRLLTGAALVFLQQVTGQPNVLSYASPLLHSVGFNSAAAATLASTGFGVVKVVGTIPAVLLVDRLGPKSFLCVGAVAMGISLVTLGVVTSQSHTHLTSLCQSPSGLNRSDLSVGVGGMNYSRVTLDDSLPVRWNGSGGVGDPSPAAVTGATKTQGREAGEEAAGNGSAVSYTLKWVSLISLLVYVAAFSVSLGPMVYVVISEIFPTGVRGKAVSVVSAVNWATNLLISMTFLTVTETIGVSSVMFLYAAMSFVLLVFVILCVPETRGRTLEQISKELAMKKHFDLRFCKRVQPQQREAERSLKSTDTPGNLTL